MSPKEAAGKQHQSLKKKTGKTGREVFRFTPRGVGAAQTRFGRKRNKHGDLIRIPLKQISRGDPGNRFPEMTARRGDKTYAGRSLQEKGKIRGIIRKSVPGGEYEDFGTKYKTNKYTGKVEPMPRPYKQATTLKKVPDKVAIGSVAKRIEVKVAEVRYKKIAAGGVGSRQEKLDKKNKAQQERIDKMTPEELAEFRDKTRVSTEKRTGEKVTKRGTKPSLKRVMFRKKMTARAAAGGRGAIGKWTKMMKTNYKGGAPMQIKSPGLIRFGKSGF